MQGCRVSAWPVRLTIGVALLTMAAPASAQFPAAAGYVNDFAGVLADEDAEYLENYLRRLERDTSAEVVVVTVASLNGMTIERYANGLFAEWGIGKAKADNGVLLLVVPRDREVRIEVGYGLEPILTDGLAGDVIRTIIVPEFIAGNMPRGIGRAVDRIAAIVRRDPSTTSAGQESARDGAPPALLLVPFFAVFVAMGGFATGLGIRTKTYGPLLFGAVFAGIPLLISVATLSVVPVLVLLPLELAAIALGIRRGRSDYWITMLRTGSPHPSPASTPSAWIMGGRESSDAGSFDGGGAASGGASDFGGGSSGGGGASGRW